MIMYLTSRLLHFSPTFRCVTSSFLFIFLLVGCMPSLTPSPDPYQGKCDPLPVSATLVFPEEFKEYSFRFDEPVHSTHIYFDAGFEKEFRIGESSEKLFLKGFRCMFENVTVGVRPSDLSVDTVLYIPKIESVSAQVKPPGANVEANVT